VSTEHFLVEGRRYVTLEVVARCYRVRVEWVQEVVGMGLLGPGVQRHGVTAISAEQLDLAAKIVQMHFHHGIELLGIRVLLRTRA
jgi:hypothetical protein